MPNMQGFSQKCRSALNLSDIETEGQEECVNLDKKSVKSESNFEGTSYLHVLYFLQILFLIIVS